MEFAMFRSALLALAFSALLTSCVTDTDLDGNPVPFFSNVHVVDVPVFDNRVRSVGDKTIKVVSSLTSEPLEPNLLSEVVFSTYPFRYSINAQAQYRDKRFVFGATLDGERLVDKSGPLSDRRNLRTIELRLGSQKSVVLSFPRTFVLPFTLGDFASGRVLVLSGGRPQILRNEVSAYDYFADRSARVEVRDAKNEIVGYLDSAGIHLKASPEDPSPDEVLELLLACKAVREELFFDDLAQSSHARS